MSRSLRTGLPAPRPGLTTLSSLKDRACVGSSAAKGASQRGLRTTARGSAATHSDQGPELDSLGAAGRAQPRHGSPWAHPRGRALSPSLETWLQSPRPQPSRLPAPGGVGETGALSGAPRGARQGCAGKAMMTLLSCGHQARGAEDRADSVPGSGGGCYVPSQEPGGQEVGGRRAGAAGGSAHTGRCRLGALGDHREAAGGTGHSLWTRLVQAGCARQRPCG